MRMAGKASGEGVAAVRSGDMPTHRLRLNADGREGVGQGGCGGAERGHADPQSETATGCPFLRTMFVAKLSKTVGM